MELIKKQAVPIAVAAGAGVSAGLLISGPGIPNDLGVYLLGAGQRDPYVGAFNGWTFTYPPAAALLLSPLRWVDKAFLVPVWGVLLAASALAAGVTVAVSVSRPSARPWAAVVAALFVLFSVPSTSGIVYGNISALLVAACVLDLLLLRDGRWHGVPTGIAAAVKLTPAALMAPLLLSRRWAGAAALGLAFLVPAVVGAMWSWDASVRYWGSLVWDTQRVGGDAYGQNWSLLGVLSRHAVTAEHARPLWLASILILLAALAVMTLRRPPRWSESVLSWGLVSCLITPVTWSHHALWLPLGAVAILLGADARLGARIFAGFAALWCVWESLPNLAPSDLLERAIGGQWINDIPAVMMLAMVVVLSPMRAVTPTGPSSARVA